jgi:hypothetical protein
MPALPLILAALSLAGGGPDHRLELRQCPAVLPGWLRPSDGLPAHRIVLDVRLRGHDLLWGGRRVTRRALRIFLSRTRRMEPAPFILFDPSGAADCAAARSVRDLIDASLECGRSAVCGQGPRAAWAGAPPIASDPVEEPRLAMPVRGSGLDGRPR